MLQSSESPSCPLINERFTNNRMGAVYVYPVEIYVQVNEPDSAWWTELTAPVSE